MNAMHAVRTLDPDNGPDADLAAPVARLIQWVVGESMPRAEGSPRNALQAAEAALVAMMRASALIAEQQARIEQLERMALTDELTGLSNRRGFARELRNVQSAMRRYDEQGLLLYIDLDDFKAINDTHGHAAGDVVLRRVGRLLREGVRDSDAVGRLGGDEFAVLLTHASPAAARARAEDLERDLNAATTAWRDQVILIRASVGLRPVRHDDSIDSLLNEADKAMYLRKRRNQKDASPMK